MMLGKIASTKALLSSGGKIDENFVYFIAFLYSISTGEIGAVDLFKTGKDSKYGKYSGAFRDTFRLGVGWSYGLAAACEKIAKVTSNKKDDPMKLLLVKLSQVIRLGDDMKLFFRDELKNALATYKIKYEANLETQKLFSEMFYTLMSTASFMISANSIMSMLMGFGDAEQILMVSMMGTGAGMAVFVAMMFMMFPRDILAYTDADMEKKFRMKIYMAIGASMGITSVLLISGAVPPILAVALGGAPLLYPGIIAKKAESKISSYTEWYPTFILHFGQLYSTVGSMGQALQAVMRSNFGTIQTFIDSLKNRIKNRIDQTIGFELFSIESGNHLIASGNSIFSTSIDKGADMNLVGNVISDVTKKINELRGKRAQNASTFQLVVIILHVLSLSIFGLMNKLTELFNGLSSGDLSNAAFELTPINPDLMNALMPLLLIMTSVISGFAIKIIQGGIYKTVFFHIGLLLTVGGISMFSINFIMEEFLDSIIFTAPVPGV
ncbi:flagellar assembly protein FlaJ [Nitrosopumilus sp.]|uniref:flagellar assembly protein FlaJ n=1 Tax=Nitrosopumilus sp. TaxID=2024843 RepID=UPI002601FD57|nr:flagellar assembly protein FlaJ [Nitrosopumilus sp.]